MTTVRVTTDCLLAFDWATKNLGADRFAVHTNFHSGSIDFILQHNDALVFMLANSGSVITPSELAVETIGRLL